MIRRSLSSLILISVLISILATSCSRKITQNPYVIFPSPPDTTRIQFLTKFGGSNDIIKKRNSFAKFILGEPSEKLILKPYGVAIYEGKIYVCDAGTKGLEILNLEKNSFEYFIPTGKGQLKLPLNCCIDEKGYIYVADAERAQIVIFDKDKNYVSSFGESDKFKPTDVFIKNNKIWVVNLANHKINVYSKDNDNKLLYSFPESESGNINYLYSPTNIFVNDQKVYVSDMGDFKIKMYSQDGKFLDTLGTYGKGIGQLARPKGIATDKNSNLYVVDAAFENVQIFNNNKKLLMYFGGSYTGVGYMWLPAKVVIDYDNVGYFQKYVDPNFKLKYIVIVTNQYGPDKVNIYGFVDPIKTGK